MMKVASSRANGEGSIYQRSSDGRWLGVLTLGYSSNGRLIRKTVPAKTMSEVVRKLKQLQRQFDDGIPLPDATLTVAQLKRTFRNGRLCLSGFLENDARKVVG